MPYRPEAELKRPDLKGEFVCATCHKTFCHAASLNRHRLNFHGGNHFCTICKEVIPQKETVRRHMGTHGYERIFTCGCCNWAFPDKKELHVHTSSMSKYNEPGPAHVIATTTPGEDGSEPAIGVFKEPKKLREARQAAAAAAAAGGGSQEGKAPSSAATAVRAPPATPPSRRHHSSASSSSSPNNNKTPPPRRPLAPAAAPTPSGTAAAASPVASATAAALPPHLAAADFYAQIVAQMAAHLSPGGMPGMAATSAWTRALIANSAVLSPEMIAQLSSLAAISSATLTAEKLAASSSSAAKPPSAKEEHVHVKLPPSPAPPLPISLSANDDFAATAVSSSSSPSSSAHSMTSSSSVSHSPISLQASVDEKKPSAASLAASEAASAASVAAVERLLRMAPPPASAHSSSSSSDGCASPDPTELSAPFDALFADASGKKRRRTIDDVISFLHKKKC